MNLYFSEGSTQSLMLSVFIKKILHAGVSRKQSDRINRNIIICNMVAIIFSLAALMVSFCILFEASYLRRISGLFFLLPILLVLPILLNTIGWIKLSRIFLSCTPPIGILVLSVVTKLSAEDITFNDYYNFRIALIAFCSIPFLLFSLREKWALSLTSLLCVLCLVLSDELHYLFNVGFYDIGFTDTHYDFINFNSVIASLSIIMAILSLKGIIEKQELVNLKLFIDLQASNEEIKAQRDTLMAQSDRLHQNQLELSQAYQTIERQKIGLEEELVLYNYEITQFSYNVAHHLRGPVASLAGLINLFGMEEDKIKLIPHFQKGMQDLEGVVADLNYVLGLRKDIFRLKASLSLNKVLREVMELLNKELATVNPVVKTSFEEAPLVYASKPAMISIMFNLISNALKYRDETTRLIIEISSCRDPQTNCVLLKIKDNGLGIDLVKFNHDLFKMYKRFHLHTEGKGLGLYLVKLQTIALGGSISVDSRINEFTQFIISIPLADQQT